MKRSLLAVFLFVSSAQASAPKCADVLANELSELAAFQITVSGLPSQSEKTLSLKEVKQRLEELEKQTGRTLKTQFKEAVARKKTESASREKDRTKREREKAEQKDSIEKLTRIKKHDVSFGGQHIEFLDDHRIALKNSVDLQIYDITRPQQPTIDLPGLKGSVIAYSPDRKTGYTFGIGSVVSGDLVHYAAPTKLLYREIDKTISTAAVSPSGEYLAAGADWGRLHVFKLPDLSLHIDSLNIDGPNSVLRFSHDSRYLFAAARELVPSRYSGVDLMKKKYLELPEYMKDVRITVSDAAFEPGGHTLYIATREGKLHRWNLMTGVFEKSVWPNIQAEHLQFSPSGKHLFVSDGDGRSAGSSAFRVIEVATGRELEIDPSLKGATLVSRGVSRDSSSLIAWTRLPREEKAIMLHVIETETLKSHTSRVEIAGDVISPVFSPDGKSVFVATGFGLIQIY